jgi:DNA invertase Pin-like site-specific DNA recombinase
MFFLLQRKVMVKVYIYLRCSTGTQSVDTHSEEIKNYCFRNDLMFFPDNVYRDQTVSGNKPWKERQISTIIDKCERGDHIVVSEMSRLSRRALDLHSIIGLCDEKGIYVHCIKEGFRNDGTMTSILLLGMLSTMSQMEREFAVARTKSAIETMRKRGIKMGPKFSSDLGEHRDSIEQDFREGKLSHTEIANKYDTTYNKLLGFARRRKFTQRRTYENVVLRVPETSPTGRKCRGSKYDKYIDEINRELQDPTNNLSTIVRKYGFEYDGFKTWFDSRSR